MPDPLFDDPRLAAVYDPLDPDRGDLDGYVALVQELDATTVLDIGCGTGVLAIRLAAAGIRVVAVDPALASLDVARAKPGAERVTWVHGTVADVPPLSADLAVMTANVAQVFVTDEDWIATLVATRQRLRPGGRLAFETRDPDRRAWERWTPQRSRVEAEIDGIGRVSSWHDVQRVELPLVTFRSHVVFHHPDGDEELLSTSTLCFRTRDELRESLREAGFAAVEERDLFYRPGLGWVLLASA